LGAGSEIQTGERLKHFLPGFGFARSVKLLAFRFISGSWGLKAKEGPGFLQFGFGIAWGHEAEVTDLDKPWGKNVQQKPADKLRGGGAIFSPPSDWRDYRWELTTVCVWRQHHKYTVVLTGKSGNLFPQRNICGKDAHG
jgi:hypothetical protein